MTGAEEASKKTPIKLLVLCMAASRVSRRHGNSHDAVVCKKFVRLAA